MIPGAMVDLGLREAVCKQVLLDIVQACVYDNLHTESLKSEVFRELESVLATFLAWVLCAGK